MLLEGREDLCGTERLNVKRDHDHVDVMKMHMEWTICEIHVLCPTCVCDGEQTERERHEEGWARETEREGDEQTRARETMDKRESEEVRKRQTKHTWH